MNMSLHPAFMATDNQKKWLKEMNERTGESVASIIRGLIQEKIDNK